MLARWSIPLSALTMLACEPTATSESRKRSSPPASATDLQPGVSVLPTQAPRRSKGQLLYVPIYSHLRPGTKNDVPIQFGAHVSVRNTSTSENITLRFADYYDDHGTLVEKFMTKPERIEPLGSRTFTVTQADVKGGPGANFIVEWAAEQPTSPPIVESIMLSTAGTRGFAFARPSSVLRELKPED